LSDTAITAAPSRGPDFRARRAASLLGALAVLAVSLTIVCRSLLATRFGRVWGDRFDGDLEVSILEHWHNVLAGHAGWAETLYFYPHARTLGYNDGYLLFGVVHALFRSLGIDAFSSGALVDVVFRAGGFGSFLLFARAVLHVRLAYALLGAMLFVIGHALFEHAWHEQLLSVALAPLLGYLMVRALQAASRERRSACFGFGAAAALLFGAWLLTAFYMAWFFGFYAAVTSLVAVLLAPRAAYRQVLLPAARCWPVVLGLAAVLALALLPFLYVYLPKAAETGMHPWTETLSYIPRPNDLVNVGRSNRLFGLLFDWFCARCSPPESYELMAGIPPILFCLFLCAVVWSLVQQGTDVLARAMALAVLAVWAMIVRHGDWTLWRAVYALVPGARAIRVVARFQIFLTFPICALTVLYLDSLGTRTPRTILALLIALLVLEELGPSVPGKSPAEELRRIAVPPPPPECRAFYVTAEPDQDASSLVLQV
jgi:hypothetical protein